MTAHDVQLLTGETADCKEYLARTLPNLLKMAYQKRSDNDGILILSAIELSKLDTLGGLNRFMVEPLLTYEERSRVVYNGGTRRHNITGLLLLQRLLSREQFCKNGCIYPQEKCDDSTCTTSTKVGCGIAMSQVDGGHSIIGRGDGKSSTALNAALVFRL